MSDFHGRTALVAGAAGPLGVAACLRLARAGAQVIALDKDDDALRRLALKNPSRINTLSMSVHSEDLFARLGDAWGDEPLHVLLNFLPVSVKGTSARIAVKTALMSALGPGLIAARGSVVTVVREVRGDAPAAHHGQVGAVLSMLSAQGLVLEPHGVRSNAIVLGSDTASQAALSSVLYLASRFSRRLNRVVLPAGRAVAGR